MLSTKSLISEIDFGKDNDRIQARFTRRDLTLDQLGRGWREPSSLWGWVGGSTDPAYQYDLLTARHVIGGLYNKAIFAECTIIDELCLEAKKRAELELRDTIEAEVRQEMAENQKPVESPEKEFYQYGVHMISNLHFRNVGKTLDVDYREEKAFRRRYSATYNIRRVLCGDISDRIVTNKEYVARLVERRAALSDCVNLIDGAIATYVPKKGVAKPRYRVKATCIPMAQAA